jgi:5-methylcytosine-specific restriction endonuclease McrA
VAGLVAAGEIKSGPQPGDKFPGAFHPVNVTGEAKGEKKCLVCANGANPVAMVFARTPECPMTAKLLKKLDEATIANEKADMGSFAVYLTDAFAREAFAADKQKTDGRRRTCRACDKERRRLQWQANLEREHERRRRYREQNAEQVAQAKRAYQAGKGKERSVAWEKRYKSTPAGRAMQREAQRRYGQTERGRLTNRVRSAKRWALLKGATGTFTREDWQRVVANQGCRCFYCHQNFTKARPATMDHVIPLSKGGPHTPENIVAACRVCNSRKWNRLVLLV